MSAPALELTGIRKSYGENHVLHGIDLTVAPGEIHALLGENGAGKSTLIKILAGVERRDAGQVMVGGLRLAAEHSSDDVQEAGVAFVHQNLGLLDTLSIADNVGLYVGFPRSWRGIDRRAARERARGFLTTTGLELDPERLVGELAPDEKVLVAVARAFALKARTIVLDEVSATLPAPEMARLSQSLLRTRESGVAYLFVTHRLHEVYEIADRMTVLRDGKVALQAEVSTTDHADAVEAIVGRRVSASERRVPTASAGEPVVQVQELSGPGLAEPVSFDIAAGEVLGVCGLVGSGTRTLARLLGGAERPSAGHVLIERRQVLAGNPAALHRDGVAYVPGQRLREGLLPSLGIRENLFPLRKARGAFTSRGVLRGRDERRRATALATELEVRPAGQIDKPVCELSGGNQQKVVLGRALADGPRFLVLEDPTAGVDVGSRQVLHGLVRDAVAHGTAVLLVSTDYDEVATEADRVLVLGHGRVVAEVSGADIDSERLAQLSHGAVASVTTLPDVPEGAAS
jgi:ribose transport system ATP-binding protein